MKYLIPIAPQTLDLIQELNDGVRPVIQDVDTFYAWNGPDEHAEIIAGSVLDKIAEGWDIAKIGYRE